MKNLKYIATLFLSLIIFSCSDDMKETIEDEQTLDSLNEIDGKPGIIPSNIIYENKLLLEGNDTRLQVNFLKEIKSQYKSEDFYNNLFELTSYNLFTNEDFSNINNEDLIFLIKEMRSLESNVANIENIPILLKTALKSNAISKDEYFSIAKELISKNEKEIDKMQWPDENSRKERVDKIEKAKISLFYARQFY